MRLPTKTHSVVKARVRRSDESQGSTLSESSIATYTNVLVSAMNRSPLRSLNDFLRDHETFDNVIKSYDNLHTRATIYAAAYKITQDEYYREQMMDVSAEISGDYEDQRTSARRQNNIDSEQVKARHEALLADFHEREERGVPIQLSKVMDAFITGLYGAYDEVPPRRLEYAEMKKANFEKGVDNYVLPNGLMVFNQHKNARREGSSGAAQTIKLPGEMMPLLAYLLEHGPGDYLLTNNRGEKFSHQALNKRLQGLFGKYFGADSARSAYLSNMHKETPSLRQQQRVARQMGNSVNAHQKFYVKKT